MNESEINWVRFLILETLVDIVCSLQEENNTGDDVKSALKSVIAEMQETVK